MRFTAEAQEIFCEWRCDLERRLRDGSITSPALESHLAKYRSLFPSLTLIFHLVDVVEGQTSGPVNLDAAARAAAWCEYLETHARRLYATIQHPAIESARVLLSRLAAGAVPLTDGAFRTRDIYLKGWTRLSTPEEVSDAVAVLEDNDWLTTVQIATGGRPKVLIYPDESLIHKAGDRA